ncbi:STAS domain-containing protein [Phytohabitans rumicis]|nr:STAS domain-containing protein [Phytohabitans rumicis]
MVVSLRGELDLDTAAQLRSAVDGLLARDATRIVVDLAGLSFCDSVGLSTFTVAGAACAGAGGYLRLAAPTPFLLRLLGVVGVLHRLSVYDSVEAACQADSTHLVVPPDPGPKRS